MRYRLRKSPARPQARRWFCFGPRERGSWLGAAAAGLLVASGGLVLAGCQSAASHRESADRAAAGIIAAKQQETFGEAEAFSIERPSQTFRERLMLDQQLVAFGAASYGTDALDRPRHWPRTRETEEHMDGFMPEPAREGDAVELTLADALRIAATNSRAYQAEKEALFRTALQLDLERFRYDTSFRGALEGLFRSDQLNGGETARAGATAGLQRQLQSGANFASAVTLSLVNLLRGEGPTVANLRLDTSITVPLLRGAGRHVAAEPLTQAERNVLYALYDFELFKHDYAVRVAREYYAVLQQRDQIANAEASFRRIELLVDRTEALFERGRVIGIEVDQGRQNLLRARQRLIAARENYERQLDQFKLTLGLPTDARIALSQAEFDRLQELTLEMFGEEARPPCLDLEEVQDRPVDPGRDGRGRYEVSELEALDFAMENRLDLRIAEGLVFDAQRRVVVAADDLRPGLNLSAGATLAGTAVSPSRRFSSTEEAYFAALDLEAPWSRRSARVNFRQSLIQLEAAVRSFQNQEDQVKFEVRNALRNLLQQREGFRIQTEALNVAVRRMEQTQAFQEVGRADTRDVLEANDDLLQAQNALVDALVGYRVAELILQRDLGLLQVDSDGVWTEFDLSALAHPPEESPEP